MSIDNTQRDDETTVLPVADEEETTLLPAVEADANSVEEESASVDAVIEEASSEAARADGAPDEAVPVRDETVRDEAKAGAHADESVNATGVDTQSDAATPKASTSASVGAEAPVDGVPADDHPSTATAEAPRATASASSPSSPAGAPIPAAPAAAAALKEAPASGVRVAQLVWAGLVIMLGVFMIAISFLRFVSIPLLLISLIAALGIALMAAAVVTSVKKG